MMTGRRNMLLAGAGSVLLVPWLLSGCGPARLRLLVVAPGLTSARLAEGGLVVLPVTCKQGLLEPPVLGQLTQRLVATLHRQRRVLHPVELTGAPEVRAAAIRVGAQAIESARAEAEAARALAPGVGARYVVACDVTDYSVVQDSEMRDRQVDGKTESYTLWSAEATMKARLAILDTQTGEAVFRAEHSSSLRNEQESRHATLLGEVLSVFEGGLKPKIAAVGEKLFGEVAENLPA